MNTYTNLNVDRIICNNDIPGKPPVLGNFSYEYRG